MEKLVYAGYTRTELTEAFNKVQNKEHWKEEINAVIAKDDYDLVSSAVCFFTGGGIEIVSQTADSYTIYGAGYWRNGMEG